MLNANIKEIESSIGVLQSEKDEIDVRCSVATDKNKAVRKDDERRRREEIFDEREGIF